MKKLTQETKDSIKQILNKNLDASPDFDKYYNEVNKGFQEIKTHVAAINKIIYRLQDIDNHTMTMDIDSKEEAKISNQIKVAVRYAHDYVVK